MSRVAGSEARRNTAKGGGDSPETSLVLQPGVSQPSAAGIPATAGEYGDGVPPQVTGTCRGRGRLGVPAVSGLQQKRAHGNQSCKSARPRGSPSDPGHNPEPTPLHEAWAAYHMPPRPPWRDGTKAAHCKARTDNCEAAFSNESQQNAELEASGERATPRRRAGPMLSRRRNRTAFTTKEQRDRSANGNGSKGNVLVMSTGPVAVINS